MARLSMGVSNMKVFLMRIAAFFVIISALDLVFGEVLYYLQSSEAGGRSGAEYFVCKESCQDVLIMGSSRASHHYVPEILSQRLGMSCFNAGQDGNGIILQYGRWKMINKRYVPKLIIYDINPSFDLAINDNMTYIDRLKPFCNDKDVRYYLESLFPLEGIKLFSKMYCYNYKFIEIIADCFHKSDYMKASGYIPLYGVIRKELLDSSSREREVLSIVEDSTKVFYLEQLVKEANSMGTKIVFSLSPSWQGGQYNPEVYETVRALALKYSIPFFEFTDDDFCENPDYFKDSSHLNDKGARLFSEEFASWLRVL